MAGKVRISLANKCQLLFGAALVLIVTSALTVVWFRMEKLVRDDQQNHARQVADLWLQQQLELLHILPATEDISTTAGMDAPMLLRLISREQFEQISQRDAFLAVAIRKFQLVDDATDQMIKERVDEGRPYYRYARAIRASQVQKEDFSPAVSTAPLTDPLEKVLVLEFSGDQAQRQRVLNLIFVITAGLVAMLLAIGMFWFVTTRIILSPVRVLRDTAGKIAEGDTNIRSDINTGDEFEQLSEMFNTMVDNLNMQKQELRQTNKSLDLKLGELAEHNVALFEANKIKDEFLANVSHELRTPLHSTIGFAEVLEETLKRRTGPTDEKRKRYIANIITSSRRLLDLINDLLDLAKIEAGRMELHIEPMSVSDAAEGLINLIRPQAEKAKIKLQLTVKPMLTMVNTDPGKVQQIVFNFLSNAVKFTPKGGTVTLSAESIEPMSIDQPPRVRISVTDTGPGIAPHLQEKIFEKFTQLDSTETREHDGTGLGLTISRNLATLLQGEVDLVSEVGSGATFSLTIPVKLAARTTPLMPQIADDTASVTTM